MSHDRGCPCGREKYEYEDCKRVDCFKKEVTVSQVEQVGGTHYKVGGNRQHWDYADKYLGYLDGYASKYITRWRRAAKPVQDVEKAISCMRKLLECYNNEGRRQRRHMIENRVIFGVPHGLVLEFLDANKIDDKLDRKALMQIMTWEIKSDITDAISSLENLLEVAKAEFPVT